MDFIPDVFQCVLTASGKHLCVMASYMISVNWMVQVPPCCVCTKHSTHYRSGIWEIDLTGYPWDWCAHEKHIINLGDNLIFFCTRSLYELIMIFCIYIMFRSSLFKFNMTMASTKGYLLLKPGVKVRIDRLTLLQLPPLNTWTACY